MVNKFNTKFYFFLFAFVSSSLVFLFPIKVKADVNMLPTNVTSGAFKRASYFEKNIGQTNSDALYLYPSAGYKLMLFSNEAVIAIPTPRLSQSHIDSPASFKKINRLKGSRKETRIKMQFLGANKSPRITGKSELKGKSNYFIGKDQAAWLRNVPHYNNVAYEDLYPDIDLIFYSNGNNLEYDFIVKREADPGKIRFTFEGIDRLSVDSAGNLVLIIGKEELRVHRPKMYQMIGGNKVDVIGDYILYDNIVGFQVATYDHSMPLVIDPVLSYSTYMGDSGYDEGRKIAVDADKNAYVVGVTDTLSIDGTNDLFVAKFDSSGQLVFSSILGGTSEDLSNGITVDSIGNVYLAGTTGSDDFPTTPGVIQPSCMSSMGYGCGDSAFVAKISSSGSNLLYSTFLSGGPQLWNGNGPPVAVSYTESYGIAVDQSGNAYIAGSTQSPTFPVTPGAFQTRYGGSTDAFIAKLNSDATQLVYSTFLGGFGIDEAYAIAIDADGNAYVAGNTASPTSAGGNDFPVKNALQPAQNGLSDGFVAKLNPTGSGFVFSTFLGGSDNVDGIYGLAVDSQRNVYVTGQTKSANWPGAQYPSSSIATFGDGFVSKLAPSGNAIIYSRYLGGGFFDNGTDIAADASGNAYVIGTTNSLDFPVTEDSYQEIQPGNDDFFITKIDPFGEIVYSTFLGGPTNDYGNGIAVGSSSEIYVTGSATSTDFPVATALQPQKGGYFDAIIAKIDLAAPVYKLSIVKNGDDNNIFTIKSDPPGIQCGQYCTASTPYDIRGLHCNNYCTHYFDAGTQVKLIITPDPSLFYDLNYTFSGTDAGTVTMSQEKKVTVAFIPNSKKLTVSVNGTGNGTIMGGGTVTSDPAGISCTTGSSAYFFKKGSTVKLIYTPDINSIFAGWAGSCTNTNGNCTVTMDTDKSTAATFSFIQPVRIAGLQESYFDDIAAAYAALTGNGMLQVREYIISGNLLLNKGNALTLKGGYDLSYGSNPGYTTLLGTLTIDSGSLTAERLIIK